MIVYYNGQKNIIINIIERFIDQRYLIMGYLDNKPRGFNRNMFSTRHEIVPEDEPDEIGCDPISDDDDQPVIIRPKKKSKRLPGERLLKQLHRMNTKKDS